MVQSGFELDSLEGFTLGAGYECGYTQPTQKASRVSLRSPEFGCEVGRPCYVADIELTGRDAVGKNLFPLILVCCLKGLKKIFF